MATVAERVAAGIKILGHLIEKIDVDCLDVSDVSVNCPISQVFGPGQYTYGLSVLNVEDGTEYAYGFEATACNEPNFQTSSMAVDDDYRELTAEWKRQLTPA